MRWLLLASALAVHAAVAAAPSRFIVGFSSYEAVQLHSHSLQRCWSAAARELPSCAGWTDVRRHARALRLPTDFLVITVSCARRRAFTLTMRNGPAASRHAFRRDRVQLQLQTTCADAAPSDDDAAVLDRAKEVIRSCNGVRFLAEDSVIPHRRLLQRDAAARVDAAEGVCGDTAAAADGDHCDAGGPFDDVDEEDPLGDEDDDAMPRWSHSDAAGGTSFHRRSFTMQPRVVASRTLLEQHPHLGRRRRQRQQGGGHDGGSPWRKPAVRHAFESSVAADVDAERVWAQGFTGACVRPCRCM
jgi:hypothetical protein